MSVTSRRVRGEEGQALILNVLVITVLFVVGAIAVSAGLWISEHRGAQTDADFAALAGAWELLDPNASPADAIDAATANLAANDEQLNASLAQPIVVDNSCFGEGPPHAVTVDVNHDTAPLFAEIFNVVAPIPGAHAKACAGAVHSPPPGMLTPFEIADNTAPCFNADETPNFTALCGLEFGSQGQNQGNRGLLDLYVSGSDHCSDSQGGANTVEEVIEWGADGTCVINDEGECDPARNGPWYDCVSVQPGNAQAVLNGVSARISREGACDTNGNGIDDFDETVVIVFDTGDPTTSLYEPRDCDPTTDGKQISPRIIAIIVLEEEPGGNPSLGRPIKAIAGFYLAGCLTQQIPDPDIDDLNRKCESPGGGPPGQVTVYGQFVNLITSGGGVGPPSDSTTLFGIALVE